MAKTLFHWDVSELERETYKSEQLKQNSNSGHSNEN